MKLEYPSNEELNLARIDLIVDDSFRVEVFKGEDPTYNEFHVNGVAILTVKVKKKVSFNKFAGFFANLGMDLLGRHVYFVAEINEFPDFDLVRRDLKCFDEKKLPHLSVLPVCAEGSDCFLNMVNESILLLHKSAKERPDYLALLEFAWKSGFVVVALP